MHFPSTYWNYSFLHLEKMHLSLEVFKEIQSSCWDDTGKAPKTENTNTLPCRPGRAPLLTMPVHIYKRFSLWGSTNTLGQNFPRQGHWLFVICSFIPSTSFFCTSSMLGTRYNPRWIGHSAYPQGDYLGEKQKKTTIQGRKCYDNWTRREGAPGHVGGGEAGRVGPL